MERPETERRKEQRTRERHRRTTSEDVRGEHRNPEEGEIIHGVVIKVLKEYVAVNINRKSEGMLPLADLTEEENNRFPPGTPST